MGWVRFGWFGKRGFTFCGFRMVVTRDFELQYIETKEVPKIRGIDMDCGITIACFVKIHGISDVKEMEYCKGRVFFWDKRNKIKGNMRKRSYLRINCRKVMAYVGSFMPTDTIWPIEVAGDLDKSHGGAKIQSHEGWFMILVEFVDKRNKIKGNMRKRSYLRIKCRKVMAYVGNFMPTDTIWSIEVAGDLDKSDGRAKIQSHEGRMVYDIG
ncbi:hypothetical protein DY000_02016738 [Brassica cretica]|uniref:Uncharacterized protein n=1 Tax=Brassica cretica TaxID=69181 RepID=A0ABQ7DAF6_BRACR|nr:hypothetical protein DY000_02016738 [Brassica cretica]